MVGKPNLPKNSDETQSEALGASTASPELSALDQEREASMADEGGAAGAEMERQPAEFWVPPSAPRSATVESSPRSSSSFAETEEPEHAPLSFAQWNLRQRIQRASQQRWGFVAGLVVGALAGRALSRNRASRELDSGAEPSFRRDSTPGIH